MIYQITLDAFVFKNLYIQPQSLHLILRVYSVRSLTRFDNEVTVNLELSLSFIL